MIMPKFTPSELRYHLHYVLFDPPTWVQFLYLLAYAGTWKDVQSSIKENTSILQNQRLGITYYSTISYRRLIVVEWPGWRRFYRFPFSLQGKTVLDLGAGCGETALFYHLLGAKKIICVEQNRHLIPFLEKNRDVNHMNVEILNESFTLNHLGLDFDAVKMDIDGGEREFLNMEGKIPFPMVAEIHGNDMANAFLRRGLQIRRKGAKETTNLIMDNFGRR